MAMVKISRLPCEVREQLIQKMKAADGTLELKILHQFISNLVALRRGGQSAERLLIESKHQIAK